jgi:hypothetical protein
VIVAGRFRGSVDFGQGVQTAGDDRGFVVNLGP